MPRSYYTESASKSYVKVSRNSNNNNKVRTSEKKGGTQEQRYNHERCKTERIQPSFTPICLTMYAKNGNAVSRLSA